MFLLIFFSLSLFSFFLFFPQSTADGRFQRYRQVTGDPRTDQLADRYIPLGMGPYRSPDDPRGVKQQKERSTVDVKGSIPGSRFVSPSASTTSISPLKVNSKVQQNDPRLKRTSDSSNLGNNRGSNDAATLGHSTQFCAVDKLRISAMKPSSERCLRDMDSRNVKSKDGAEVLGWKFGTKRTSRSSDQSEEVSLCSADSNFELTAKDFPSSSLNFRNLPSLEGTSDVQNFSKATNAIHAHQKVENHKKAMLIAGEGTALDIGDDLNPKKPIIQSLPNEASIPMHPLRASVIPELDYIWQYDIFFLVHTSCLNSSLAI
ncbi:hypothetical protein GW17_00045452 [Ensete ventricosum]|nr:hypothetical protein GW17_00045452 [Ensete ventricosum]